MNLSPISILVALALVACGGARPIPQDTSDTAARDADRDRDRDDEEEEEEEYPLDPAATVEGTGVRIQPPRGSERSAIGATFIHPRRRIQLVIASADGDLSVHQQFRTSLVGEAEEVESEEVEIDGGRGHVIVDRMDQGGHELERVWVLVRRGTRTAAAMGVYQADRSDTLRGLMRASVMSLRFDDSAPIDPEIAVGWRVDPVEGLQLVRTASMNVSYSVDGAPPENGTEQPMLFLVPLPIEVPEDQRSGLCGRILEQLVQLEEGGQQDRQAIDAGEIQGCDVAGESSGEGVAVATYAALVFRGPAAFMIGGTAPAAQREAWIPRFRGAARTLQATRPMPARSPSSGADDEEEEEERPARRRGRGPAVDIGDEEEEEDDEQE